MNRRILGIRIGTVLSVVGCLAAAVLFWLFVKYSEFDSAQAITLMTAAFRG